jgi:hypothetical protein
MSFWKGGSPLDLNSVLKAIKGEATPYLYEAGSINDLGWIVCNVHWLLPGQVDSKYPSVLRPFAEPMPAWLVELLLQ